MKEMSMIQVKYFILLLSILVSGCTTLNKKENDVGEWVSLTDDNEESNFSKKYGMLATNNIFDGMAFWEDSPIYNKPPYSFHWYRNKFLIWIPYKDKKNKWNIVKYELEVNKCEGLSKAINILKDKIKESASKMINDGPDVYRTTIVMSPIFYKIKIFPPNMLGSIMLNNIEWDRVSWIEEAKKVKAISSNCVQN